MGDFVGRCCISVAGVLPALTSPDTLLISSGESPDEMSLEEAEFHTSQAKYHADKLRYHVWVVYTRKGYAAMGYASFAEWVEIELQIGYQWAMKLKDAEQVNRQLSPQGELHVDTKGALALKRLDDAEQRQSAYNMAIGLATIEGNPAPQARHIEQAVAVIQKNTAGMDSLCPFLRQFVQTVEIGLDHAINIQRGLDGMSPKGQGYVLQLMGRYGIVAAELVPYLGALAERPESLVRVELERTGCLGGTPLQNANLTDWRNANEEARKHHVAESEEDRLADADIEAVIVTVYRAKRSWSKREAADKTLRALIRELGEDGVEEIITLRARQLADATL